MKAFRVLSAAALLVALTAGLAGAHSTHSRGGRLEAREHRTLQGQRWNQRGRMQGQLTWREAARLRASRAQILAMERIARADGIMTPRERLMIQRAKQQQMQRRFWLQHNGRTV